MRILTVLQVALMGVVLAATAVAAPPERRTVDKVTFMIDSQPLPAALTRWALQSGMQFAMPHSGAEPPAMTPTIEGKYTPLVALALLLQGSGYSYVIVDRRTVFVSREEVNGAPDTIGN